MCCLSIEPLRKSLTIPVVLFGMLHRQWVAGTLAGMMFAVTFCRRGILSNAVVAHTTSNGLLSAYVLATGRWSLWSQPSALLVFLFQPS
jgi:CAAX prenyl protease-like protein